MKQATLLFLIKEDQILLAMKKRGFGAGHWNGVGGKPSPGENIEDTAVRECQEEINVTPLEFKQVATLEFYFPEDKKDWNQEVIVYICTKWQGTPVETEEMRPQWYTVAEIPYDQMWPDDKIWLPEVLAGKKVNASFHFDKTEQIEKYDLKTS